jgi:glycosyltransferase involved in cell wall biosynthesis
LKEVKRFDDEYVFDFRRISRILFKDQFHRDVFKDVYRTIFSPKKASTTFKTMLLGFKNMNKKTLRIADYVLVQTEREALDLKDTYDVDFKWEKVCNGVSRNFLIAKEYVNTLGIADYIICVGRIEPRKNQLSIIQAVHELRKETGEDLQLVFVGAKTGFKHFEYTWRFNNFLKKYNWIKHINSVPYNDMPSYYHYAKVCVSASWFETTGLTSLEAVFSGTNAVAAGERAKEYLGEIATYCDPGDVMSIKESIKKEYYAKRPVPDEHMKYEYTWENAARKTQEVYNKLLGK